jgi:hypothetical protein
MHRSNSMKGFNLFDHTTKPLGIISDKFRMIEEDIQKEAGKKDNLACDLYLFTKQFLELNSNLLSPRDKGEVLKLYVKLWKKYHLKMLISDTPYAHEYAGSTFREKLPSYPRFRPMMVGFNLKNAIIPESASMYFLSVNLHGANFTDVTLEECYFANSDLSKIVLSKQSTLNKCEFRKCILQDIDFTSISLCETLIIECDVTNTIFNLDKHYVHGGFILNDCVKNGKSYC